MTDNFKFVVNYEVELSHKEQKDLKNSIPVTPMGNSNKAPYHLLPEDANGSESEELSSDGEDKCKKISINLNKNFQEILNLQAQVQAQCEKNLELI